MMLAMFERPLDQIVVVRGDDQVRLLDTRQQRMDNARPIGAAEGISERPIQGTAAPLYVLVVGSHESQAGY